MRHLLGITKLDKVKNQCIRQKKNWSTEHSKGNKTVPQKVATTCTEVKDKAVPLQTWSGPEGSRKLRFPDFMTTAQDGGKVVSLTHRPPLPPGNSPGTHFC